METILYVDQLVVKDWLMLRSVCYCSAAVEGSGLVTAVLGYMASFESAADSVIAAYLHLAVGLVDKETVAI